nr:serine/threonine-protein kinase [uncultured Arsenicibacter sp.]
MNGQLTTPPGTILDYKLVHELGKGGQGTVYYAENAQGQPAAVKILNAEFSQNADLRQRFMREAQIMVQLSHPGIGKAYHFYQDSERVAIIMEYLQGEDLQEMLNRHGAVMPQKAIEWFRQILTAFQYAHDRGVVHRDIKPSNIFLTRNGAVKVLDFSIAKMIDPEATQMSLTGPMMTLGTPLYMSPEQITSPRSVDYRADIYSLGVLLYTLLAGQAPFGSTEDSHFSLHQQIVSTPLPRLAGIPDKLNAIIARATAKKPELRYTACSAFLLDLEQVYSHGPVVTVQPGGIRTNPGPGSKPVPAGTSGEYFPRVHMLWISFLAPPVGAWLLSRNFRAFDFPELSRTWLYVAAGWAFSLLILFSVFHIILPSGVQLVLNGAFLYYVHQTIETHLKGKMENAGTSGLMPAGVWKIIGLCLLYFFGLGFLIALDFS